MLTRVRPLVSEALEVPEDQITEQIGPDTLSEWDSLNHLRLITMVEEEFSISFSMDEVENIRSVRDLVALLETKVAAA